MSVLQTRLPILGVGFLKPQEEPNQSPSAKKIHVTSPTDCKKLVLHSSGQQLTVNLPLLSVQYSDLASLDCFSQYEAGSFYCYPSYPPSAQLSSSTDVIERTTELPHLGD